MQQQNFFGPKHGCSLSPAMEDTGEEQKANERQEEISESGWTMYLDQSIHEFSSYKNSLVDFEEEEARNRKNGYSWFQHKDEEDSSMASDASSGPAQLLEVVNHKDFYNEAGQNGLKLSLSECDVSGVRKPKRRRVESDEHKDLDLLEDTASSPLHSFKSGLTENEAQNKDFSDFSKLVCDSHDQADAVNKRLDFLQSILPEAPMCREETVGVAIKYISALEQRIKVFQGHEDKNKDSHVVTAARDKIEGESGVLRDKGLCLVPISTLWNAI
ncbi:hypothetical protein SUGI_0901450 [Cryptomeria japonica]|uniref:protein SOB FIVE-LIKE 6 n=1 Tax=Cryptomeria japonica TaxID=3369 RepID=UPI002414C58C|nr:protein SOB FIVE-LIKE 6 [Cryptomeria japonica]GLJ43385.1 hypothetical protein SUGI_0901450 [Cryptomeria japonica]